MRTKVILFFLGNGRRDFTSIFEPRSSSPQAKQLLVDSIENELVDPQKGVQKKISPYSKYFSKSQFYNSGIEIFCRVLSIRF